jgi:hypothetical protein
MSMVRLAFALAALALAGCASAEGPVVEAGGDVLLPSENSFNVHLKRGEGDAWMLTVGYGGDIENAPKILLDGKKVELEAASLSGFGLYYQTTYELTRPGAYRIEKREKPEDEEPRAVYSFTIRT